MRFHHRVGGSLWIIAMLGCPCAALAQSGPGAAGGQSREVAGQNPADNSENEADTTQDEGDIIVTARRREERLADVPSAASVIGGEALAKRGGAVDTGELLADQPSVRFNNLSSSLTSEISIRASSTARATIGDPSVGLYRNGNYIAGGAIGGRNFTRLDFLDIGRVEVLRGTQGALYGRNAVGGAVNIVSQKPVFDTTGFIDARYTFENRQTQIQGAANISAGDGVAFRFSGEGIYQDHGFFYDAPNDVYFDQQKGYGARAQARVRKGSLDLTVLAETQDLQTPAISYQIAIPPGTPGFPGGYTQDMYDYPWNTAPSARQDVDTLQANLEYDLGGGTTLSSSTLYRRRVSSYSLDNDGVNPQALAAAKAAGGISPFTPINPNSGSFIFDNTKIFSQDLHVGGSLANGRLTWLAGIDILLIDSAFHRDTTLDVTDTPPGSRSTSSLDYNSYAGYGSLGFDLADGLNIAGEVRYTKDDRSFQARLFDLATGVPIGGAGRQVNASTKPDNVSFNATLSYAVIPDVLVYGKVGTSYRAGGFNVDLGDPRQPTPIPAAYDNENSTTYEVGVKGQPGDNLYFALAGYYNDVSDLIGQRDNGCQIDNANCPVAPTSFLTNVGGAHSYGVEGEVTGNFDLAGGQLRTALSGSWQGGKVVSGILDTIDLAQVPDFLASANIHYRHEIGRETALFGNLLYSSQFGGTQELLANSAPLDDFNVFNVRVGVERGRLRLTAFAKNLTNDVHNLATTVTVNRYSLPRRIGLEARLRW